MSIQNQSLKVLLSITLTSTSTQTGNHPLHVVPSRAHTTQVTHITLHAHTCTFPFNPTLVEIRSGNSAKKRAVTYIDPSDNENDNNDDDTAAYKLKQPQPRPKKKGSVNTTANSRQVSAPATTTAYEGSSNKQKSTLGDIYNTLHNRRINNNDDNNNSNGSKSSSMLKARKDTSFENQENIDVRRSKDDGGKTAKKPSRQSTADMSREQV